MSCRCYTANELCPREVTCDLGDPFWLDAHAELRPLHLEKSGGYGTGQDPLANFTAVAAASGRPAFAYPVERLIEKAARCESLIAQGRYDELAEEFLDMASLALCAEALRRRPGCHSCSGSCPGCS